MFCLCAQCTLSVINPSARQKLLLSPQITSHPQTSGQRESVRGLLGLFLGSCDVKPGCYEYIRRSSSRVAPVSIAKSPSIPSPVTPFVVHGALAPTGSHANGYRISGRLYPLKEDQNKVTGLGLTLTDPVVTLRSFEKKKKWVYLFGQLHNIHLRSSFGVILTGHVL